MYGLSYGYGNWKIEFSNGYYKESESIDICKPSMWENNTAIASVITSIEDSTPVDIINSMKNDLATLLDDRLSVDIMFSDIVTLSDLGYNVTIATTAAAATTMERLMKLQNIDSQFIDDALSESSD